MMPSTGTRSLGRTRSRSLFATDSSADVLIAPLDQAPGGLGFQPNEPPEWPAVGAGLGAMLEPFNSSRTPVMIIVDESKEVSAGDLVWWTTSGKSVTKTL